MRNSVASVRQSMSASSRSLGGVMKSDATAAATEIGSIGSFLRVRHMADKTDIDFTL